MMQTLTVAVSDFRDDTNQNYVNVLFAAFQSGISPGYAKDTPHSVHKLLPHT